MKFKSTQIGWAIIGTCVGLGAYWTATATDLLWIGLSILALVLFAFSTLSVSICDDKVEWFFGLFFFKRHIQLTDIRTVEVVATKWWYGYGVRYLSGGTLYSVSGLKAVKLVLHNGKAILIGSDKPETLARKISEAISRLV